MSIGQLCGLSVLCAALALILKTAGARLSPLLSIGGGCVLLALCLQRYRAPVEELLQMAEEAGIRASLETVLRMLAIGVLAALAADLCRDLGEPTLAARVELCGRAEILLLCLPFLRELFSLALGMVA